MKRYSLRGRRVVVTGASSGLGLALTRRLSRVYGCRVLGVGRSGEKLAAVAAELPGFEYRVFDVSKREAWEDFARSLGDERVDVLISAAGILPPVTTLEEAWRHPERGLRDVMDTDFWGAVNGLYALLPRLEGGVAVNIASASAFTTVPGMAAYAAAKAAQRSLTEAAAYELAGRVRVISVCPGFVRTELFRAQPAGAMTPLVLRFTMSAERCARLITRGVERGRRMIVPGFDGKLFRALYALLGTGAVGLVWSVLRRSGIPLFREVAR